MSVIIGIDPGLSGCIVALSHGDFRYLNHLPMPTVLVGSRNRVNGAAVSGWFREHIAEGMHVYIERVGSVPINGRQQGGTSMFSFGHAAGVVEGIVQGLEYPCTLVDPVKWKKHAGLIGTDKDAARARAIQLYPDLRALDAKGKGQALADAILIARFGAA